LCPDPDQTLPGLRRPVEIRQRTAYAKRRDVDVREPGGDEGHGRRALHLLPTAYDAATRTPEESLRLHVAVYEGIEPRVKIREMGCDERQRQGDGTISEATGDALGALEYGVLEGGLARYGRGPLHPYRHS
jgi:hypothetical protein